MCVVLILCCCVVVVFNMCGVVVDDVDYYNTVFVVFGVL